MNILLIGGTGFISGRLREQLLERGHGVTLFTRGRRAMPADRRCEVLLGDRDNPASLERALHGRVFDAVYDMVAYDPAQSSVIAALLRGRVGRFIHCSTVSVYMVSEKVRCPITEDQITAPLMGFWERNPFGMQYGIDKRSCEEVLWKAHDPALFPVTVLRPTFVSGPHDPARRDLFWIERLLDGGPVLVPGCGDCAFQAVFVDDVARAFADCLTASVCIGRAYNIAAEEILSLNDYLALLAGHLGVRPVIEHIPLALFDRQPFGTHPQGDVFPFNVRRTAVFSLERARHDLGFRSTPVDTWIAETIRWWRSAGMHAFGFERRSEEIAFIRRYREASTRLVLQ